MTCPALGFDNYTEACKVYLSKLRCVSPSFMCSSSFPARPHVSPLVCSTLPFEVAEDCADALLFPSQRQLNQEPISHRTSLALTSHQASPDTTGSRADEEGDESPGNDATRADGRGHR